MFNNYSFTSWSDSWNIKLKKYFETADKIKNNPLSKLNITQEKVKLLDDEINKIYLSQEYLDDIIFDLFDDLFVADIITYIVNSKSKVYFTIWEWNYSYLSYIKYLCPEFFVNRLGNSKYIKVEELLNSDFYKYL